MRVTNLEQPFHPIYSYAAISDAVEGLILVNVNTLADRDPQNNFLESRDHLEREQCPERRASRHARRPLRLRRRPTRAGDRRSRRSAEAEARRGGAAQGRARDARCSSAICSRSTTKA